MEQLDNGGMGEWSNGAMEQWSNWIMEQLDNGAKSLGGGYRVIFFGAAVGTC